MDPVFLARPERFELPTTWFEARYSIQLSYGRKLCILAVRGKNPAAFARVCHDARLKPHSLVPACQALSL